MLKAVIFDMDGVIVDTEPGYKIATDELLLENGIVTEPDYQDPFIGASNDFMWTTIINDFNLPYTVEECVRIVDEKRALMEERDGLHMLPGVFDLIKRFKDAGMILAIASSSPMEEIHRIVDYFHIRDYFQVFTSGTDCAESKPHPEVFLRAAAALHTDVSECLVIEDSKNGLLAAKAAQIKSIGFANPMFGNQDLSSATHIVRHFDEVTLELCNELVTSTL